MGLKYKAGLSLIAAVVVIWVTSAEVTQDIFSDYKQPFAVTYLGASLLVIYLPVAFLKDLIRSCLDRNPSKSNKSSGDDNKSSIKIGSPKGFEIEIQGSLNRKESDAKLSGEQSLPLIRNVIDDGNHIMEEKQATTKEIARYGFCIAPIWFITEYFSNAALSYTSVASTTVLSATSGLFTLLFGVILGQDSINVAKVVAVLVSLVGVIMTTFGKTWAADEPEFDSSLDGRRSLIGDCFGILSATAYGLFTVLLKKFAGEEGERIDMQKLFGYMGLFSLVAMWWLVWPLTAMGIEPKFTIPHSAKTDEIVIANGLIGTVISDYFWALCVVWTTPLVATLGMSLTIPLAMIADMVIHGRHYSVVYILGSVQVFLGFVIANVSERIARSCGL